MTDLLIMCLLSLTLSLALLFKVRTSRRRLVRHEDTDGSYTSTRRLIGEEAYREMNRRVESLLGKHKADECISVNLTCGPDNEQEAAELHHLLPGEPVNLSRCSSGGMDCIDVYSRGFRIGRLVLKDADDAIEVMNKSSVTGAYVAEQNCYGESSEIALRIVIFHSPERKYDANSAFCDKPYKIRFNGATPIELIQN